MNLASCATRGQTSKTDLASWRDALKPNFNPPQSPFYHRPTTQSTSGLCPRSTPPEPYLSPTEHAPKSLLTDWRQHIQNDAVKVSR